VEVVMVVLGTVLGVEEIVHEVLGCSITICVAISILVVGIVVVAWKSRLWR
jgi:hypothetical protein